LEIYHKEIKIAIATLPLVFGLHCHRLRISSFDVSTLAHLLNKKKNEDYKITDLTQITMGIKFKKVNYFMN
jgi:hypothetical protein